MVEVSWVNSVPCATRHLSEAAWNLTSFMDEPFKTFIHCFITKQTNRLMVEFSWQYTPAETVNSKSYICKLIVFII